MCQVSKIEITKYISSDFLEIKSSSSTEAKRKMLDAMGFIKSKNGFELQHNTFAEFFCKYVIVVLLSNKNELSIYNRVKGIYEMQCNETIGKLIRYFMNQVYDL